MSTRDNKNAAIVLTVDEEAKIATLTLKMEGRANKINEQFATCFAEAVGWVEALDDIKGVILATGHKDFCVGADIDGMFVERDPVRVTEGVRGLNRLCRALETLDKPVVAALTGSALGGGYEIALACNRRIALDSPAVLVGLPEVSLGLIPGAGGTQRLPRLIGIQGALENIVQGKILRAPKALAAGLVDELAPTAEAVHAQAKAWIQSNPSAKQPWDEKNFRWPHPRPGTPEARNIFMASCALLTKKTAGAFLAPQRAISAVQEGAWLTFERSLEVETRHFVKLATGDQSKDMIRTLWYHKNAADKQEGLPKVDDAGIENRIKTVGILGAGMMGAGLAYVCAERGYEVVLKDIDQGALERGLEHCNKQAAKLKWLTDEARAEILGRISGTLELAGLDGCDLIIEAVVESIDVKRAVNKETEPTLSDNGIWASNTSAIPITDLASESKLADRFIGMHFFSPVEKMPLLEIIMGKETSEDTLARSLAFAKSIRKTAIVVNDGYGFFTSRVFGTYIGEAAQMVTEGHDPVLIEYAARAEGMVVSPLQVFDEVSLSLAVHAGAQGRRYNQRSVDMDGSKLIQRMVEAHDRKGKAAGGGFYDYKDGRRCGIWKGLAGLIDKTPDETGVALIGERLMLIQCVEAARCADEGILRQRRDAEVGAIFGIGFAPNRGGPLAYMDRLGIRKVVTRLDELAAKYGDRYAPPPLLRKMADTGETFFEVV